MSFNPIHVEQAQFLLSRKVGATSVLCAIKDLFEVTSREAQNTVEQARFLLELDREDQIREKE